MFHSAPRLEKAIGLSFEHHANHAVEAFLDRDEDEQLNLSLREFMGYMEQGPSVCERKSGQ